MPVELTHVGEAVVARMVDTLRWSFVELCGLTDRADRTTVCDLAFPFVRANVKLCSYAGKRFDGACCVDLVVRIRRDLGVPFELKLGETRLNRQRVNEDWLSGCEPSHEGKAWSGNMMSVLERTFPASSPEDTLKARFDAEEVPLSREWFVVARPGIIASWAGEERPAFSANVKLLSFESVVNRFGGKGPFNAMVRELLDLDFHAAWVAGT